MRLVLIRHAESAWNREGRLQGVADSEITEAGAEQASRLASLLPGLGIEQAVSSTLGRARTTAELLELEPRFDPEWREADLGDWTGMLVPEIPNEDYVSWRRGEFDPPGGETNDEVLQRVSKALSVLGDVTTAVVTHGGVIRAVLRLTLGLQPRVLAPLAPASLTIVEMTSEPRLVAYNLSADFAVEAQDIA